MSTTSRYLCRLFLVYFGVSLVAFAGPLLGLDLVENAEDVLATTGGAGALARYGALRLPAVVSELNPIAALIAALLVTESLRRHRELVALWNMGFSPWRIMAALLPVGIGLLALQLAVDDRLVPMASAELRAWGVGPYDGGDDPLATDGTVWLRSGDHVLRLSAGAGADGRLRDLTLFRRDADGNLLERLDAGAARREDDRWVLTDVVRRPADSGLPEHIAELAWPAPIDLDVVAMLAVGPEELPLAAIREIVANEGFGQVPLAAYRTRLHERLANALSPWMMILLAISLVRGEHLRRNPGWFMVAGLGIGFAYFIYDGIVLAIGQAGWLPGWIAAWSPKALMACVIAMLALRA